MNGRVRRASLIAEHKQLCDEAYDWYSQAWKDDDATFALWVFAQVPEPLWPALHTIHAGNSPDSLIWALLKLEEESLPIM